MSKRARRRIVVFLLPTVALCAVAWASVAAMRQLHERQFQLEQAALAIAAYLKKSGGAWPTSVGQLEMGGVVRLVGKESFVVTVKEPVPGFLSIGPPGFVVRLSTVRVGWGGRAVNDEGNLLAVEGWTGYFLRRRASFLSRRLCAYASVLRRSSGRG